MQKIQANEKGSRSITISNEHLQVIRKYALFQYLVDSNGVVDDMVLNKLRMNVRALIESNKNPEDLVSFCQEVLYHDNMKPFALQSLLDLYASSEASIQSDIEE